MLRICRQIEIILNHKIYKGGLDAKRKAYVCSLCTEKSLIFSLIVRELLAIFLVLRNRLKPGIVAHLPKNALHTRVHAPTRARTCTRMHTYQSCMYVHLQTHTHPRKHTQPRAITHMSVRAQMSTHSHALL